MVSYSCIPSFLCSFSSSPAMNPTSMTTSTTNSASTARIILLKGYRHSFFSAFPSRIFKTIIRASPPQKFAYPNPIPEFAEHETGKFKAELLEQLSKEMDTFGDDLDHVIEVCAEILCEFLHKEYGGPGTLLVEPFTEMFSALKDKKLPGAPLASRVSLLWAQNHIDHDWQVWNSSEFDM